MLTNAQIENKRYTRVNYPVSAGKQEGQPECNRQVSRITKMWFYLEFKHTVSSLGALAGEG